MGKLGFKAKLYHATAGTEPAAQAANEVTCRDLSMPDEMNEIDISSRASEFELIDLGLRKLSLEFNMLWDEANTAFAAILAAYRAGTAIAMKCLSSDTGSGPWGDFKVTKCSRNEALKDAVIADIVVKPCGALTWEDAAA